MTITGDFDILALVVKVVVSIGLVVAGIRLLVIARRARQPATVVNGRVVAKGLKRMQPVVVVALQPRLRPGAELSRLADVIQTARGRIDAISTAQYSAARHLDSAEVALNRLLADIGGVMPSVVAPTVVPRRTLALAA